MFVLRSTYREAVRGHERDRQSWERERQNLLDRIMYLTDRPWTLPPMTPEQGQERLANERDWLDYTTGGNP